MRADWAAARREQAAGRETKDTDELRTSVFGGRLTDCSVLCMEYASGIWRARVREAPDESRGRHRLSCELSTGPRHNKTTGDGQWMTDRPVSRSETSAPLSLPSECQNVRTPCCHVSIDGDERAPMGMNGRKAGTMRSHGMSGKAMQGRKVMKHAARNKSWRFFFFSFACTIEDSVLSSCLERSSVGVGVRCIWAAAVLRYTERGGSLSLSAVIMTCSWRCCGGIAPSSL